MARLKIDENLPAEAARVLERRGHDAMTVNEQGLRGSDDALVAEVCRSEGRVVVTLDRGFGDPRRHPTQGTPGIVVLRPQTQDATSVLQLVDLLSRLLDERSPANSLWILDRKHIRIRGGGGPSP